MQISFIILWLQLWKISAQIMYCNRLNTHLSFFPNKINACCSWSQGPIYIENPSEKELFDVDKICELKEKFISELKNNKILECCSNCTELQNGEYSESYKIKKITFNHFTHCNCKCIYCSRLCSYQRNFTEVKRKSDYYDVLPLIKILYEKNLISPEQTDIEFQGGDCTVLDEFENIVNFILQNPSKETFFTFTTNNIIYQPIIEKCFNLNKATLITSLDSGCAETFKKIKRVDKFDDCINNLKKYREKTNTKQLFIKYIVVKNINDNINELQKFLDIMKDVGVGFISFDIDFNDILINKGRKFIIPPHYYKMKELTEIFCSQNEINFVLNDYTKLIMEKGFFE